MSQPKPVPKVSINPAPPFPVEFAKYAHLPNAKSPEYKPVNELVRKWIDSKLVPFFKHIVNLGYTPGTVEKQWQALTRRPKGGVLLREFLFEELKYVDGRHFDATPKFQAENKGKVTDLDITRWFMGWVTYERKLDYDKATVAIQEEKTKEAAKLKKQKADLQRDAYEQLQLQEAKFKQDGDLRFEEVAAKKPAWRTPPPEIKTPEQAEKWLNAENTECAPETNWTTMTLKHGVDAVQAWVRSLCVFEDETLKEFIQSGGEYIAKSAGLPPIMYLDRVNWLRRNCPDFLNVHDFHEAATELEGKWSVEWKKRFETAKEKAAILEFAKQQPGNWNYKGLENDPRNPRNKKVKPVKQTKAEAAKWRAGFNMDTGEDIGVGRDPMDTSGDDGPAEDKKQKQKQDSKETSFSARVREYIRDLVTGKCGPRPQWATTNDLMRSDRPYSFDKWLETKSYEISDQPRDRARSFGTCLGQLLEKRANPLHNTALFDTTAPKFPENVDTKTLIQRKRIREPVTKGPLQKTETIEEKASKQPRTAATEGGRAFLERRKEREEQKKKAESSKVLFSKDKNITSFAKPSDRDAYEDSLYGV